MSESTPGSEINSQRPAGAGRRAALIGELYSGLCLPQRLAPVGTTAQAIIAVPESTDTYARSLYELLREFDARGCDVIVTSLPKEEGLGLAIADRLRRAAGFGPALAFPGVEGRGRHASTPGCTPLR